jgi:hypothetical protein
MTHRILKLNEYDGYLGSSMGANPDESETNIDEAILDALVEIVGSEEEVEEAAKEAHEDLMAAFEKNEVEMAEGDVPEKLAVAALVIKLVEMGKIGPEDADSIIADHLG